MWTILNPVFLWAGLAALIPLVLHLIQRRRTVTVRFSTLRFLKLARKRSTSRLRLENLLLWLLRTLLLVLLALAFTGPIVRARGAGSFMGSSRRDIAIVWDNSYSMGYESGWTRAWETAKNAVVATVRGLEKGDRVCLFLAGESPRPLFEQPTEETEAVVAVVNGQAPAAASSRLLPAVAAACEALADSGNREREVYIVTDGQSLPWADFAVAREGAPGGAAAPTGAVAAAGWDPERIDSRIAFFALLTGAESPENATPLRVSIEPRVVMAGRAGRVIAGVGATGQPRNTTVTLFVDDREAGRRTVTLGAGGEEAVLPLPPLEPGVHACRVETPADPLTIDDRLHFLLRVRDRLPVLCVGSKVDLFYLVRGLNPGGDLSAVDVREAEPGDLEAESFSGYTAVFLCNALPLPAQTILALERYVRSGGVLAVFPGSRAAPADYEPWSSLPARPQAIVDEPGRSGVKTLRLLAPDDPLFAGMRLPPGTTPAVAIRRRVAFGPPEAESAPVVAAGPDEGFMLSRRFGSGRVILFAVSADREWSNLPLSPFFVPLLHRIVEFSSGSAGDRLFVAASPLVRLTEVLPDAVDGDNLIAPSGAMVPVRRVREGERDEFIAENLVEPGVYRLAGAAAAEGVPAVAVNLDRRESDLEPVRPDSLAGLTGLDRLAVARTPEELAKLVEEHRIGRPLAELCLWAALLVAILESLLANRAARRNAALNEGLSVDPSGRVRHIHPGAA